jgi:hypothetical protein
LEEPVCRMPPESIQLSQEWVTKVTSEEQPGDDIHIIGPCLTPEDISEMIREIAPHWATYAVGPRPSWDGWLFNGHQLTNEEVEETRCAY